VEDAVRLVQAMVFTVLLDKEGYDEEGLQRVWAELEYLSDSINQGYVNLPDLIHILREEYHLQL
jgi:hypothetical protein